MEYLRYIAKFIYRIRWWLVCLPVIAFIIAWFATRNLPLSYNVKTTIYTGIISGYNIEAGPVNYMSASNTMDNLMNIIVSEKTLKQVAIRLFSECMVYGDPERDTNYILASSYNDLLKTVPKEVQSLVVKNDVEKTFANMISYERPSRNNYIFGLLYYNHPFFSINHLTQNLRVIRLGNSDMIEIGYTASDPGIAWNTLEILNREFIDQYQEIRFGETSNVIAFFEAEIARLGKQLTRAEDSLINYNIEKRIINYPEQTKQVTVIDASHQMQMNGLLLDYNSTRALIEFYENKLGDQARRIRTNNRFIQELKRVTGLNNQIANMELLESRSPETDSQLDNYKNLLQDAQDELSNLAQNSAADENSTDNIPAQDLIMQWLAEVVKAEKVGAEIEAMEVQRLKLNEDFVYYSPVGATIKRHERQIEFIESNYMAALNSLNTARLREKNLQMTSATLRVMNPPSYPLNALPTKRKMILLMTVILTLLFTIGYFLLLEILDRTLRDKLRTERITGGKVLGAFPRESVLRYRRYDKVTSAIATTYMSKTLLPYLKEGQQNIINLISTEAKDGKSFIAQHLADHWISQGLNVRILCYDEDFSVNDQKYILAKSIKDICPDVKKNEVLIVEHPTLKEYSIATDLINEATVNLLVTRANRTWKSTDNTIYNRLTKAIDKDTKLFIYLNKAERNDVEDFAGQLPPYTKLKNLTYRLYQLGLTAEENSNL